VGVAAGVGVAVATGVGDAVAAACDGEALADGSTDGLGVDDSTADALGDAVWPEPPANVSVPPPSSVIVS
jgi:hypothetical protein